MQSTLPVHTGARRDAYDVASHGLIQTIVGTAAWRKYFYEPMRATLDSVKVEVLDEFTSGDKFFGRLVAKVMPKVTGKTFALHGTCLVRIENGKIAEAWDSWDFLGLLEQMKLLPTGSFGLAITGSLQSHPMA